MQGKYAHVGKKGDSQIEMWHLSKHKLQRSIDLDTCIDRYVYKVMHTSISTYFVCILPLPLKFLLWGDFFPDYTHNVKDFLFIVGNNQLIQCLITNVTLSVKSSLILGKNKATFCREGHKLYYLDYVTGAVGCGIVYCSKNRKVGKWSTVRCRRKSRGPHLIELIGPFIYE